MKLRNGNMAKDVENGPPGWSADTCSWKDEGFAFDIVEWEILK